MPAIDIDTVLDPERIAIFKRLKKVIEDGKMAGGTALAIILGHRKSFDFDFFYSHRISENFLISFTQNFKDRVLRPIIDTRDELSISLDDQIRITFLYFPFPPLHPTISITGIPLYSLEDQASNKAYAIGRQVEWKDYVALYVLLKIQNLDIRKILSETKLRFGSNFDEKLFWEQLIYWKDLGEFKVSLLRLDITQDGLKEYFRKLTEEHFAELSG